MSEVEDILDKKHKHPSYGMISACRCNSSHNKIFYGAETQHNNFIVLEIHTSDVTRGLNKDWYYSDDKLIQVALTPLQWAELLTSMNTTGTQCTIEYIKGQGSIESPPKLQDKIDLHKMEFEQYTQDVLSKVSKSLKDLEDAIENNKGKKVLRESLNNLKITSRNLKPNLKFASDQFEKHVDKVVTEAKQKIESAIEHKIVSLGQNALNQQILENGVENILIEDNKEGNKL